MADNENTTTYKKMKLPSFKGTRLTNDQFIGYVQDFRAPIGNHGDTLLLENKLGLLDSYDGNNALLIRFPTSFTETALIAAKDYYRDKIAKLFVYNFKRFMAMPHDSSFWIHANAISSIVSRFYDLGTRTISGQTPLIKEIYDLLSSETNAVHIKALGLTALLEELNTVNNALRVLFRARMAESGRRIATRGGKTFRDVRIELGNTIAEIIETVNVVYEMQPSEITEGIVSELLGVINKYTNIAAANGTSVPENGEDDEPDPTHTSEGDDEGEDETGGETGEGGETGGETEQPVTE